MTEALWTCLLKDPVRFLAVTHPRVGLKGTWDRGGFGPKATATGVHPAPRAAAGREAVPANHVRQRWIRAGDLWCGFYKKRKGKD